MAIMEACQLAKNPYQIYCLNRIKAISCGSFLETVFMESGAVLKKPPD